ncbi:hypothetical protein E2C01_022058 [Portunus trituberculatus]|uniref:Uncharacterized protein n=1 Tax=Portunus trituberculatus TaxID=210409 RepID=A0A5B7E682_PORTR|nr:hypothetical protein [Portunus trituberculatus]
MWPDIRSVTVKSDRELVRQGSLEETTIADAQVNYRIIILLRFRQNILIIYSASGGGGGGGGGAGGGGCVLSFTSLLMSLAVNKQFSFLHNELWKCLSFFCAPALPGPSLAAPGLQRTSFTRE